MTLTIELSPQIEEQIREAAEKEGVSPARAATLLLEGLANLIVQESDGSRVMLQVKSASETPVEAPSQFLLFLLKLLLTQPDRPTRNYPLAIPETPHPEHQHHDAAQERRARIEAIRGKYAHVPFSSEDLHRERQADKQREEPFEGHRS